MGWKDFLKLGVWKIILSILIFIILIYLLGIPRNYCANCIGCSCYWSFQGLSVKDPGSILEGILTVSFLLTALVISYFLGCLAFLILGTLFRKIKEVYSNNFQFSMSKFKISISISLLAGILIYGAFFIGFRPQTDIGSVINATYINFLIVDVIIMVILFFISYIVYSLLRK